VSEIDCAHCGKSNRVEMAGLVGADQRFQYKVTPIEGQMMQAEAIGGQLVAIDKMMRAIAREDGGRVRTYISSVAMDVDGAIVFDIAVLPIRKAK
jgi:hypothetical protein